MQRNVFLSNLILSRYDRFFVVRLSLFDFCKKGYSRKGAALSFLKRYEEAISTYEEGLKIDPSNQQLLTDLETARKDAAGGAAGGLNFFSDPQFLAQMMSNPKARELMKDPETAMLMKMMEKQPNNPS